MNLAHLETAAKYVGAIVTIIGALGAGGGIAFNWAMSERDNETAEMREDIDSLKTAVITLSESASEDLERMSDQFFNMRLALEAMRMQIALSTAVPTAPVEIEPVRLSRSPRRAPLLARRPPGAGSAADLSVRGVGEDNGSGPVIELRDSASAEAALSDAMERLEE